MTPPPGEPDKADLIAALKASLDLRPPPGEPRVEVTRLRTAIEAALEDIAVCSWACEACGHDPEMGETDLADTLRAALAPPSSVPTEERNWTHGGCCAGRVCVLEGFPENCSCNCHVAATTPDEPPPASVVIPALKRDIARSLGRHTREPVPALPDEPLDAETADLVAATHAEIMVQVTGDPEQPLTIVPLLIRLVREVRKPVEQERDELVEYGTAMTLERDEAVRQVDTAHEAIGRKEKLIENWFERAAKAEARLADLEERGEKLDDTLARLAGWDHMDGAADGPFWRREIAAALDGWAKRGTR